MAQHWLVSLVGGVGVAHLPWRVDQQWHNNGKQGITQKKNESVRQLRFGTGTMFDVTQWRAWIDRRCDKGGAEALLTMLARLQVGLGNLVGVGLSPAISKPMDFFIPP
jgi:hypothetical protein